MGVLVSKSGVPTEQFCRHIYWVFWCCKYIVERWRCWWATKSVFSKVNTSRKHEIIAPILSTLKFQDVIELAAPPPALMDIKKLGVFW